MDQNSRTAGRHAGIVEPTYVTQILVARKGFGSDQPGGNAESTDSERQLVSHRHGRYRLVARYRSRVSLGAQIV
jgi:hypothetical protein